MSCCGRQASAQAQVPQRRQAREADVAAAGAADAADAAGAAPPAAPAAPAGEIPVRLVFKGAHALGLPVGARRILVHPGQVLQGLTAAERAALWRTGLFG